jgi:hypothetical protein
MDAVSRLNAVTVEAPADPAVQSRFAALGREYSRASSKPPAALTSLVKADARGW